ncbi:DNA-protecting protein DprA [bacterium]|nr:DNA-protecting protein DprA [bacterium]
MNEPSRRLQALYLLAMARNFSPADHDRLVLQLGALEALLDCPEEELKALDLRGGQLGRLLEARRGCDPPAEISRLAERDILLAGWGEPEYPELLAQCADAPLLLFCRGQREQMLHHGIGMVGSRKCSERGAEIARQFSHELAELGIPVVSGMALGIDGAAHQGALEAGGPTVAAVGSGVDVVYPPQHRQLYEELCERGLVISEYPPGTEPLREHFPQRNRIISGLSRGIVVVEAPMGSGALITARCAIEQGREIFAVPGPISSPYVKGCHHLIKRGEAKLVEGIDDILAEFGTNRASLRRERQAQAGLFQPAGSATDTTTGSEASVSVAGSAASAAAASAPAAPALPEGERRVLELLSYEGTHVNEVVRRLSLNTAEAVSLLTLLEIRGLISAQSGGYYVRL